MLSVGIKLQPNYETYILIARNVVAALGKILAVVFRIRFAGGWRNRGIVWDGVGIGAV